MTTPSGRPAVGASRLGHKYQDLIAWQQALHAAHAYSTATEFHVESPQGATYDDVATIDPRGCTYVQAKHVVDAPGAFTLDWLLAPQGQTGESMAQKALRTFRQLRDRGPVELGLYTNRELATDDPLGLLRDPTSFTLRHAAKRVLAGDYDDQDLLAALTTLQEHLGCDRDEMLDLLGVWKLQWAYAIPEATRLAKVQMQAYGLRGDDDALLVGVDFVGSLLHVGQRTLDIAELRGEIAALNLAAGRVVRTLAISALKAEPNAPTAQVALDLQDLFGGRTQEQARGLDDWTSADQQLGDAVQRLGNPSKAPVLVHAAARLPMWFRIGTLMRATAGWVVGCELPPALYFSDDASQSGGVLVPSSAAGSGEHLVVTLSVTHDIRDVVSGWLERSDHRPSRRLDLTVPAPGQSAMAGPAAARRIAEEVKTAVMKALEESATVHVHLFLACPKPIPLLLGNQWHRLAPVTVYEDLGAGKGYQAAFTVRD